MKKTDKTEFIEMLSYLNDKIESFEEKINFGNLGMEDNFYLLAKIEAYKDCKDELLRVFKRYLYD